MFAHVDVFALYYTLFLLPPYYIMHVPLPCYEFMFTPHPPSHQQNAMHVQPRRTRTLHNVVPYLIPTVGSPVIFHRFQFVENGSFSTFFYI